MTITFDNLTSQIKQLGEDNIDLLARHDQWLENQRIETQSRLDRNVTELQNIISAQQIKRRLQQKNLVAVQKIVRDNNGNMVDMTIDIMKLPDALVYLNATENTMDDMNNSAQLCGLSLDGYDLTNQRTKTCKCTNSM